MPARRASSNAGSVCSMRRLLAESGPEQSLILPEGAPRQERLRHGSATPGVAAAVVWSRLSLPRHREPGSAWRPVLRRLQQNRNDKLSQCRLFPGSARSIFTRVAAELAEISGTYMADACTGRIR